MPKCAVPSAPSWQKTFIAMLPDIERYLVIAFHRLRGDNRDEVVQAALANACVACARLIQRGCADRVFPSVLARFAVAQVRAGRQVGTQLNVRDVLSPYAQQRKPIVVERLDRFDRRCDEWRESVLEDHRTPVFDQVQFRIDFPNWLARLSRRDQRVARWLALGHGTGATARRFRISSGRVSQLRQEFYDSWREFLGDGAA